MLDQIESAVESKVRREAKPMKIWVSWSQTTVERIVKDESADDWVEFDPGWGLPKHSDHNYCELMERKKPKKDLGSMVLMRRALEKDKAEKAEVQEKEDDDEEEDEDEMEVERLDDEDDEEEQKETIVMVPSGRRSSVWQYFGYKSTHKHGVKRDSVICSLCDRILQAKGYNTTGMRRHLNSIHKIII